MTRTSLPLSLASYLATSSSENEQARTEQSMIQRLLHQGGTWCVRVRVRSCVGVRDTE